MKAEPRERPVNKEIKLELELVYCKGGCGQLVEYCLCDKFNQFSEELKKRYKK